jgi:hypothetical protein
LYFTGSSNTLIAGDPIHDAPVLIDRMAMNIPGLCFPIALLLLAAPPAQADVMYQCVDESGHKSFSNIKSSEKGARCTAMDLGSPAQPPPAAKPAPAARTPTPGTFPRVDDNAQKARDGDRRRILESELAAERKNLEQAKKDLAEQEVTVLPEERMQYKGGGGISGGKVEARVQPYRDKVALHERNIEAIQKEISKLR